MAKISQTQRSEKEQLQPLLDFLNTDIDGLDEPAVSDPRVELPEIYRTIQPQFN